MDTRIVAIWLSEEAPEHLRQFAAVSLDRNLGTFQRHYSEGSAPSQERQGKDARFDHSRLPDPNAASLNFMRTAAQLTL